MVNVVEDSPSPIFDTTREIVAKIMPITAGKGRVIVKWEFQDPFIQDQRDALEICSIPITIAPE